MLKLETTTDASHMKTTQTSPHRYVDEQQHQVHKLDPADGAVSTNVLCQMREGQHEPSEGSQTVVSVESSGDHKDRRDWWKLLFAAIVLRY